MPKSMIFNKRMYDAGQGLPEEKRIVLYDALLGYAFAGIIPEIDDVIVKAMFEVLRYDIDLTEKRRRAQKKAVCTRIANELQSVSQNDCKTDCKTFANEKKEKKAPLSPYSPPDPPSLTPTPAKENKNAPAARPHDACVCTREETKPEDKYYLDLMPESMMGNERIVGEWKVWCDYRAKKRKKVSQEAARRQFCFLETLTEDEAIEVIETAIRNDYSGLFPLKQPAHSSARKDYTSI